MTETQPFILQGLCYTFNEFRLDSGARVCGEGVSNLLGGSLLVASTGAADHSITVAAGQAFIQGDDDSFQGMYRVLNDGPVTLQIPAGGGGNPRIDTIVARVYDDQYPSGAGDDLWALEIVAGTPTAGAQITAPQSANYLAGVGALPVDAIVLGYIRVPDADTLATIIAAVDVADGRTGFQSCGEQGLARTKWTRSTTLALATGTPTTATYPAGASGTAVPNPYYSESGGTVTFLKPGLYQVTGYAQYAPAGTSVAQALQRNTRLLHNGATVAAQATPAVASGSFETDHTVSQDIVVAAGDTLLMQVRQDSTANLNLNLASLTVTRLGVAA